jgi:uncharacterized protein (DUF305 family)
VPFRRLASTLLAAVAAAGLTSCGSSGSPLGAFGGSAHSLNSTDATFLRSMTAHEQMSLGITRLARQKALRKELRGIARTMTSEQQGELSKLGALAQSPGARQKSRPAIRNPTATTYDLARVKDATSFDYEFMRTMIERNQAALAIARDEQSSGADPDVRRLADEISSARETELKQLRAWLAEWYGGGAQPGVPPPAGGGGGQSPVPQI